MSKINSNILGNIAMKHYNILVKSDDFWVDALMVVSTLNVTIPPFYKDSNDSPVRNCSIRSYRNPIDSGRIRRFSDRVHR